MLVAVFLFWWEEGECGGTFGEELGVTPDDPADTGVDEAVLVAGDVDGDDLLAC